MALINEVKQYIRVDGTDDDVQIQVLIDASEIYLTNAGVMKTVKANGQVTFTGTPGILIPSGTQVSTPTIIFITKYDAIIDYTGTVTVDIEAVNGGLDGNVDAGTIITIVQSIDGVISVINVYATSGGLDNETNPLYKLAVEMLVSHWYENRQPIGQTSAIAFGLRGILTQLQYCYPTGSDTV